VEWVEASGKSLPEAKEMVLDMLGVAEDDAEFVVLSEPKAGLFGRLRGEARVQARVRPVAPPPKRGRRQRPERARNGGSSRKSGAGDGARSDRAGGGRGQVAVDERSENDADRSGSRGSGDGGSTGNRGQRGGRGEGGESSNGGGANGAGRNQKRRGPRNGGPANGSQPKDKGNQSSGRKPGESEESMEESLTLEQQGEAATEFLSGLVREFGLNAQVGYAEIDEETVQIAAVGDDLGLLVGPRGATLSAVQDLTRTFVQRQSENRTDRILVDVGGYREKRTAALRRFTAGIVDEVKATGEERALEPMSPADRKVVHDTVNEIEGMETRSEGTEPSRYVVIQPSS
jgi:spoIIIJ-associated protein